MSVEPEADVCLILEGTYPYILGGVSTWTHDLIRAQSHLRFHLVSLMPPNASLERRYEVPDNVSGITNIIVQKLPIGNLLITGATQERLFETIELPLLNMQHHATLELLTKILHAIREAGPNIGVGVLLNSPQAWRTLVRMYSETMGDSSFIDYFWTWRGLLGSAYSILLGDLPDAKLYHALCTGYAGLLLARARIEKQRPCVLTEHGIYTNERKIEMIAAEWLNDEKGLNLNVNRRRYDRDLRDFWTDSFSGYAKLCYEAADRIITISEANREMELADGAKGSKIRIIPNGIDCDRFGAIRRTPGTVPTIALIGRVVPIKDIKTFLHAVAYVRDQIPVVQALVIGPTDEDPEYYEECLRIVQNSSLSNTVTFTGKVKIDQSLTRIDVVVLTSISEGQPLVILEAGAAGIPSVCTDVGDCRDMLYGRPGESPPLGDGGVITMLTDPDAVAKSILALLTDRAYYDRCARAIQERVNTYYHKKWQDQAYREIYDELLGAGFSGCK